MQTPEAIDLLKLLGIKEKEAKVYLYSLEKQTVNPASVARDLREKRTTAYHLLRNLADLGLLSEIEEHKKIVFKAKNLVCLNDKVTEQQEAVKELMPFLKEVSGARQISPKVEVLYGPEVTRIFEESLRSKEKKLWIIRHDYNIDSIVGRKYHFSKRRIEAGIHVRYLEDRKRIHKQGYEHQHKAHLREVRQLPADFSASSGLMIWDESLAWIAPHEKFAVLIRSKDFTDLIKYIYEVLWSVSKQI